MIQADLFDRNDGGVTKIVAKACYEFVCLNYRVLTGDIISPKAGLPLAKTICKGYEKDLKAAGATDVNLSPYVAAGGWVGLMYSYRFNNRFQSFSVVPRPMEK
jgi:hypothetical protein